MSSAAIDIAHSAPSRRRHRLLAGALAVAMIAAGGGAVASSGLEDPGPRTSPETWPAGPIQFNDPAVVKGARGGDRSPVIFRYFGDPIVRRGAGGR